MSSDLDRDTLPGDPTEPFTPTFTGEFRLPRDPLPTLDSESATGPLPVPVPSVVVAGAYQYLNRWTFVLVVAGVWALAAAAGWGLYNWWYQAIDKTPTVFVLLVFVIACSVGGLLIAMVGDKPVASALAVAVMSAPFAATVGAAASHGLYFCDRVSRCFVGLIPY